jgi:hypothetical protein
MPNMALMGFVLRKYIGELYVADVGRPIEKDEMRDLIGYMFSFWQEGKNQNKLNVRFGSKEERELKKILCEIFQISDPNSITDARWAILNYIKDHGKYPLWTLKYIDEAKVLKHVIDELIKLTFTFTNDLDLKLIKGVLDIVKEYKFDFKLINKPENYQKGFLKFLQNVDDKVIVDETNFNEIEKYILENLQEEKGRWKEEDVRDKVYKWYIHKSQPTSNPTPPNSPDTPQNPDTPTPTPIPEKERIISKVRNFNHGEEELKNRIVKMVEENQHFSQLLSLIDKYFN